MGIEYEGNVGLQGIDKKTTYKTATEYIQNNNTIKSSVLRQKLLRDGIKEYKCEICGNSE